MFADPEYAANEMKKFEQKFHDADVNKNGVLTLAEYTAFMKREQAEGKERGNWEDERPEFIPEYYEVLNLSLIHI